MEKKSMMTLQPAELQKLNSVEERTDRRLIFLHKVQCNAMQCAYLTTDFEGSLVEDLKIQCNCFFSRYTSLFQNHTSNLYGGCNEKLDSI